MSNDGTAQNTDVVVHVFKLGEDEFALQGSVFVRDGGIGFNIGDLCIVKPPEEWYEMALREIDEQSQR